MSGTRWEWHDSGSASGHMQRVADTGTFNRVQGTYRAYLNHATTCAECGHGEKKCATAADLWEAHRAARA